MNNTEFFYSEFEFLSVWKFVLYRHWWQTTKERDITTRPHLLIPPLTTTKEKQHNYFHSAVVNDNLAATYQCEEYMYELISTIYSVTPKQVTELNCSRRFFVAVTVVAEMKWKASSWSLWCWIQAFILEPSDTHQKPSVWCLPLTAKVPDIIDTVCLPTRTN